MPKIKTWIKEAWKGLILGILGSNLIAIALNEMLKVFIQLNILPFVAIATGLIILIGVVDYAEDFEIFISISNWIEDILGSMGIEI